MNLFPNFHVLSPSERRDRSLDVGCGTNEHFRGAQIRRLKNGGIDGGRGRGFSRHCFKMFEFYAKVERKCARVEV